MVTKKPEPTEDPWMVDNEGNKVGRAEYSPGVTVARGSGSEWATITLKAGTGYNAPWLVFKPTSIEDAKDIMQHEDLEELIDLVARRNKEFERAFGGAPQVVSKPAGNSGGWKGKTASTSSEVPSGTCPTHNCDLVKVDGFTKRDGTAVSARVGCPVPKCYAKTFWQNDDGTWTEK